MIWDFLGWFVGAIIGGYVVFSIFSIAISMIFRYKLGIRNNLNLSLVCSIIFLMIWGWLWEMTVTEIIKLSPGIIMMYLYDRKKRLTKKCSHCKQRIKLDAMKCKHCQSEQLMKSNEEVIF